MVEECRQYKDSTYRFLKGLRKNSTHYPDNRDGSLEVPSKRNTTVLPKYPELFRARPLHKKIKEFEVLLLEYEEEDEDINDDNTDTAAACDRYDGGEGDTVIVCEEKECNYEGDAKWRHKREDKNDDEDGNVALEADWKMEKEGSKQTDDTDSQDREEKNDKGDRGDDSVARNKGCKKDGDDEVDILDAQQCEEEKNDHDEGHVSTAHDDVINKHILEGDDDTAAHEGGEENDNKGNDCSFAPFDGLGSNIARISDTEAGHTNGDNNGNIVAFEDRIKEVQRNTLNKTTDSDTNMRMPQSDEGGGNNAPFEHVTVVEKRQEKDDDCNDDDDEYDDDDADNEIDCDCDSVLRQSETQIAEHGDCWNGILDDTVSQYSDIQTDPEIERDDDIEQSDGQTASFHTNDDNDQTQRRTVKTKHMDHQEEDDSVSGILGIYANGQYDLDFSFHK